MLVDCLLQCDCRGRVLLHDLLKNNIGIWVELYISRAPIDGLLASEGGRWGNSLRGGLLCRAIIVGEAI